MRHLRIGIRQIVGESENSRHMLLGGNAALDTSGGIMREMLDAVGQNIEVIGSKPRYRCAEQDETADPQQDLARYPHSPERHHDRLPNGHSLCPSEEDIAGGVKATLRLLELNACGN